MMTFHSVVKLSDDSNEIISKSSGNIMFSIKFGIPTKDAQGQTVYTNYDGLVKTTNTEQVDRFRESLKKGAFVEVTATGMSIQHYQKKQGNNAGQWESYIKLDFPRIGHINTSTITHHGVHQHHQGQPQSNANVAPQYNSGFTGQPQYQR